MKKLIIGIASALGFAFFANAAEETVSIGSSFTVEQDWLVAGETLKITLDDNGTPDGDKYWTAAGEANIDSVITAYDDKNPAPVGFGDVGSKFLAVDQSDVLNRHFLSQGAEDRNVAIGDGLYIDTLVQFTAADTAPEATTGADGDKLIVWLQEVEAKEAEKDENGEEKTPAVEPATNLVVTAGYYYNGVLGRKDYVIYNVEVNPNEWYRLTIRAISNIGNGHAGFVVYINENYVKVGANAFGTNVNGDSITVGGAEAELNEAGAVFPSLVGTGDYATKLTSVGLKGTGKIDNLSLSNVNPSFIVLNKNYTVTWDQGVVSFKYKIGDVESESISTAGRQNYPIELGTAWPTITFTDIVYAEGYGAKEGDIIKNTAITTSANNNRGRIGAARSMFEVNGNGYATFEAALTAGGIIKLLDNFDAANLEDGYLVINEGEVTIDLNGKIFKASGADYPIELTGTANLTIIDTHGDGKIIASNNFIVVQINSSTALFTLGNGEDEGATLEGLVLGADENGSQFVVKNGFAKDLGNGFNAGAPCTLFSDNAGSSSISESLVDGYWVITYTAKGDEPSTVYVAEVGGTQYETLGEAIAAAANGATITLLDNVNTDAAFEIADKSLTINLKGKTIATTQADTEGNGVFHVQTGGELTLNGDGIINGVGGNKWNIAIFAEGGKVIINGGTYTNEGAQDPGPDGEHFDLIYVKRGGSVEINGGTFMCQTPDWTLNSNDKEKGTIVVKGGSFLGFNPSNCTTEGAGTNWCADGYEAVLNENTGYWIVQLKQEQGWDAIEDINEVTLPEALKDADIDLKKLKDYAKAYDLTVAGAATMDPILFALNLAPGTLESEVQDTLDAFKVTISIGADGKPVIETQGADDFNIIPEIQGATEVNGDYTAENLESKRFFKAVIKVIKFNN